MEENNTFSSSYFVIGVTAVSLLSYSSIFSVTELSP